MTTIHIAQDPAPSRPVSGLHQLAVRVGITGVAVFLAMTMVPGIAVESLPAGLAAAIILTVLNLLARPVLLVLSFPLIVLTLGLFIIVINALLLEFTAFLVHGFTVASFWSAIGGALVISFVTMVLQFLTGEPRRIDARVASTQHPRPPIVVNPGD